MTKQRKLLCEFGPFRLDSYEHLLLRDGAPVMLTPKAFEALVVFIERRGRLVEKDELLKILWPDSFVEEHNLANHISTLRKALGEAKSTPQYIETVSKRGYRFVAEVRVLPDEVTKVIPQGNTLAAVGIEEETEAQARAGQSSLLVFPRPQGVARSGDACLGRAPLGEAHRRKNRHRWWPVKGLFGAAVLMLAIKSAVVLYFAPHSTSPAPRQMKAIPFTSFLGEEYMPCLSPDGNLIAFNWNFEKGGRDEDSSIYVKQVGLEEPRRLTFDADCNDWGPVWSPDGQRIAFNRGTETDGSICIVPALGGPVRKVLSLGPIIASMGGLNSLAWSPDGKFIAYTHKDAKEETARILLVSPDTFARQTLTSPPAGSSGDFNPAFSPDGLSVAFVRQASGGGDVYVAPVTGGEPRRLTFDNSFLTGLTWTADGCDIIYSSSRAGGGDQTLWRIPATGGTSDQIALNGSNFWFPNISRNGNRLAYVHPNPQDGNIYRVGVLESAVPKSAPTKLIASTRDEGGPQFSPDGRRIAFHSDRSGESEIWICDRDGSNVVQLTSLNKPAGLPRWSPDGKQIVFDVYEQGKGDVYTIDVEGALPRPIVTDVSDDHWPSWSADGQSIYFASDRTGNYEVWKVSSTGGEPVQITRGGGLLPLESPDGKYVYYNKGARARGLWRMPVGGGKEVRVLDSFKSEYACVVKDGIYYINSDAADQVALEFFDFATRREKRIAGLGKVSILPICVAVSPDRSQILYTQNDQTGADIMLVEGFR